MSASDVIIDQLVAATKASGPSFAEAWERLAPDVFCLKSTGACVNRAWCAMVLQQIHVGAMLDEVLP